MQKIIARRQSRVLTVGLSFPSVVSTKHQCGLNRLFGRLAWTGLLFTVCFLFAMPVRAETWALLIGVDKYDSGDITPLKGAVNDALALQKALIETKLCATENILLLTTRAGDKKPDRAAILEEVESLQTRVKKGDTVFVFFSGHGCQDGTSTYMMSADVRARSINLV